MLAKLLNWESYIGTIANLVLNDCDRVPRDVLHGTCSNKYSVMTVVEACPVKSMEVCRSRGIPKKMSVLNLRGHSSLGGESIRFFL